MIWSANLVDIDSDGCLFGVKTVVDVCMVATSVDM